MGSHNWSFVTSKASKTFASVLKRCDKLFSHPSTHVKRERMERKTSRLEAHQQQHQEGLALGLKVILDSGGTPVGPGKTRARKAVDCPS